MLEAYAAAHRRRRDIFLCVFAAVLEKSRFERFEDKRLRLAIGVVT